MTVHDGQNDVKGSRLAAALFTATRMDIAFGGIPHDWVWVNVTPSLADLVGRTGAYLSSFCSTAAKATQACKVQSGTAAPLSRSEHKAHDASLDMQICESRGATIVARVLIRYLKQLLAGVPSATRAMAEEA